MDEGNHFKQFSLIADVDIPGEFVVLGLESYSCSTEMERSQTHQCHIETRALGKQSLWRNSHWVLVPRIMCGLYLYSGYS